MEQQILFICAGNTCRSPLAEVIARQVLAEVSAGFSSAGLQARPGLPASPEAQTVARERGLDLSGHRSRRVEAQGLVRCSWAIGMTWDQVRRLKDLRPDAAAVRIGLLGLPGVALDRDVPEPAGVEVIDPFGAGLGRYRAAAGLIERLLGGWAGAFAGHEP